MTVDINWLEAIWISSNSITLILTLLALFEARADRLAVAQLDGLARRNVVIAQIRREVLRLVVQVLMLIVVIPGIFIANPATLSVPIVALIAVPIVLLLGSLLDVRDRRRLSDIVISKKIVSGRR